MRYRHILGFQIEQSKEKLTNRAGLPILEEYLRVSGLYEKADEILPEPGSNRGFKASRFVRTVLGLLFDGGRYLEEVRQIGSDEAYSEAIGESLAGPDALGDWLRRVGMSKDKPVELLNREFLRSMIPARHWSGLSDGQAGVDEGYTLDIDATKIVSDKGDAHRCYDGTIGYQPLLGVLAESGIIVGYEFRQGNESPAAGLTDFVKGCENNLSEGVKISCVRSDSAGYNSELVNYCEDTGKFFTITGEKRESVRENIGNIPAGEWKPLYDKDGIKTDREVAEYVDAMEKTKTSFRVIVQRWRAKQLELWGEYRYHLIITNLPQEEYSAQDVVHFHNQRGEMESRIGELKYDMMMRYMPCGQYEANAVFFGIGVLGYNIIKFFQRDCLSGRWQRLRIGTIRYRLLNLAGKLVRSGRRLILQICCLPEVFQLLLRVRTRIRLLTSTA